MLLFCDSLKNGSKTVSLMSYCCPITTDFGDDLCYTKITDDDLFSRSGGDGQNRTRGGKSPVPGGTGLFCALMAQTPQGRLSEPRRARGALS